MSYSTPPLKPPKTEKPRTQETPKSPEKPKTEETPKPIKPPPPIPKLGTLRILSSPEGADVLINGQRKGETPLSVQLEEGPYQVEIRKDGFKERKEQIKIQSDKVVEKIFTLERRTYPLRISTTPKNASVTIDGEKKGNTPLRVELFSTQCEIEIEKEGYEPIRDSITLSETELTTRNYVLKRNIFKLKITTTPPADIYLDNEYIGNSSVEKNLKSGSYNIRISKEGYKSKSDTIFISGQDIEKSYILEKEPGYGWVEVTAFPSAEIEIDGVSHGTVPPLKRLQLLEGRHRIVFKLKGYPDHVADFEITENQTKKIHYRFY